MKACRYAAITVLGLMTFAVPLAADSAWPGWRGQGRDGKAVASGLLQQWPAEGPALTWQANGLGTGYSSLAVAAGKLLTLGDLSDGQYVIALDSKNGKPLWKARIGPIWEDRFPGPRSTPTVDGDRVYALGTEGDLVCLEAATGKEVWRRKLAEDFGGSLMKAQGTYHWKFSESPLVDGDRVVVTPGSAEATLVALDKATGKEIWRSAVPSLGERGTDGAGYSSVVISEGAGVKQYVQLLGRGVVGVEAATGRFLWGYNRVANDVANIATPIVDGDHVFVSTGYGTGSALLKLEASEKGVDAKEVYWLGPDTLQNHHGGLVLHEGHVYGGTGHNKGLPVSLNLASGKLAWGPERNEGNSSAAVTYADGHLYFRYQDGRMILIEATSEAYREHGSFMIPNVERESWSHPVIAAGKLYLREQDTVYCYDIEVKERSREAP